MWMGGGWGIILGPRLDFSSIVEHRHGGIRIEKLMLWMKK